MASSKHEASQDAMPESAPAPGVQSAHLTADANYDAESTASSTPGSPILPSRSYSFGSSMSQGEQDEREDIPPLERLTIFDFLENLALPQRLEKIQTRLSAQTDRVRKQQEAARRRVVDEWRKRLPPPEERYDRYRKRMKTSVDKLGATLSGSQNVTTREKVSFIAGVLNIFISGYLVGAFPQYFHWWYTAQLCYFYPIRFYTYHKRGYHYFLVDLCYFVNLLLLLSIWVFPNSKRLFISKSGRITDRSTWGLLRAPETIVQVCVLDYTRNLVLLRHKPI